MSLDNSSAQTQGEPCEPMTLPPVIHLAAGFAYSAASAFLASPETPEIIRWKGNFYWYATGKYICVTDDDIKVAVTSFLARHLRSRPKPRDWTEESLKDVFVRDVLLCLKAATAAPQGLAVGGWIKSPPPDVVGPLVSTVDRIIDLGRLNSSNFLFRSTPRLFSLTALPVRPDVTASCERWRSFLAESFDGFESTACVLQEAFGYSLLDDCRFEKFFLLFGCGNTGKSTVVEIWKELLGAVHVSSVPLDQFGGRFSLAAMVGKLVNIVFDSSEIAQTAEGVLKTITSGEPLMVEQKHKDATTQRLTAKLIVVSNVLPKFHDVSTGLWRRIQLIHFPHEVPTSRRDTNLKETLRFELPGILNWSLEGLSRLLRQRGFTYDSQSERFVENYRRECNPVAEFFDEECEVDTTSRVGRKIVYQRFNQWSRDNGFRPESSTEFYRKISSLVPQPVNAPRDGRGGDRMLVGFRFRSNDISTQFAEVLENRGRD